MADLTANRISDMRKDVAAEVSNLKRKGKATAEGSKGAKKTKVGDITTTKLPVKKKTGSKGAKKTKVGDITTTKLPVKKKTVFAKKEGKGVNKDDVVRVSQQVFVNPDGGGVKKMQTTCSIIKLHDILASLNECQKEAVRELGFGGLLTNKLSVMPLGIGPWLVENFRAGACCQIAGSEKCNVTALDVRDVFMLPFYPNNPVKYFPKHTKGPEAEADQVIRARYKEMFKSKLTKKLDIPLPAICEYLKVMNTSGDFFKRLFVLCICGYFLAPTAGHIADMRLVGALENVDEIKRLDWCSFVVDRLVEAIKKFQAGGSVSTCNECIVLLLICYLHRFPHQGRQQPRVLPLIHHWSDATLKARIIEEKELCFGTQLLDRDFPISKWSDAGVFEEQNAGVAEVALVSHATSVTETEVPTLGDGDGESFIRYKIPDGLLSNSQIHATALNENDASFMILKRDMDVVMHAFKERSKKAYEAKKATDEELRVNASQKWWSDPKFHEVVDQLIELHLISLKDPSFSLGLSQAEREATAFKMWEGIDFSETERDDRGNVEVEVERDDIEVEREEVEVEKDVEVQKDFEVEVENPGVEVPAINVEENPGAVQSAPVVYDNTICKSILPGCSRDLGKGGRVELVSNFMCKHRSILKDSDDLILEVADYCFYHADIKKDVDSFAVFTNKYMLLNEDVASLLDNVAILSGVIDMWSLMLNKVEIDRTGGKMRRFCFELVSSDHWARLSGIFANEFQKKNFNEDEMRNLMQGSLEDWFNENIHSHKIQWESIQMVKSIRC